MKNNISLKDNINIIQRGIIPFDISKYKDVNSKNILFNTIKHSYTKTNNCDLLNKTKQHLKECMTKNEQITDIDDFCSYLNKNNISLNNTLNRDFGFIITRCVISDDTNYYWNHNIELLNDLYPNNKIVIIDDFSNPDYLKSDIENENVTIINNVEEYRGRGELLPYIYYNKHKFFDNAVIIHDGVFFHELIEFNKIESFAIPLWQFNKAHNKTGLTEQLKNASVLDNNDIIIQLLTESNQLWSGCFGVQSFINHRFLSYISDKYKLENLINVIKNRNDRSTLERIFGVIFFIELGSEYKTSILGDIEEKTYALSGKKWNFSLEDYNEMEKKGVIKIWTGR